MFNHSCEIMITHHSIVGIRSLTTPQDCIGPNHECNNDQFKSSQYGFRQTVESFQLLSKMWTIILGWELTDICFVLQVFYISTTENSTSNSLISMTLAHCLCKFQFLNPIPLFHVWFKNSAILAHKFGLHYRLSPTLQANKFKRDRNQPPNIGKQIS